MSTKINHGRIMRNANLEKALAALVRARPLFVEQARRSVAAVFARKLAFGRDLAENFSFLDEDRNRWCRKNVDQQFDTAYRNQDDWLKTMSWDFTYSVAVLPYENHVLMLTYGSGHPDFRSLIESAGFTDYHFQNSTDRPDDVSALEWEEREAAWDSALPTGRAVDSAFEFSLASWTDLLPVKHDSRLIRSCEPSEQQRREYVAQHLTELEEYRGCSTVEGGASIFRRVRQLAPARVEHIRLSSSPLLNV
ncbi:TPA: hypothetical protein ACKRQV_001267 [Pseudomonas aeruginosa]|nr:hypothetical protein [Pseudomonas aeruginosa]